MENFTDLSAANSFPRLQAEGIEADVVVYTGSLVGMLCCEPDKFRRFFRIHCQRLFAQDMLAGLERSSCHFEMQTIRRSNMNGMNLIIMEQFIEIRVGMLQAKRFGCRCGFFQARAQDTFGVHTDSTESLDMDCAHESSSNNCDSYLTHVRFLFEWFLIQTVQMINHE